MDKNLILMGLGGVAVAVIAAVLFFEPSQKQPSFDISASSASTRSSTADISINTIPSSRQKVVPKEPVPVKKTVNSKKRIDPTIKYIGTDHYGKYIIELIDPNPEDKDIVLSASDYVSMEGKINGKQFSLKVPKEIINSPNLKLKIIDKKTKKSKLIQADFLSDLAGLPPDGILSVNIDLNHPNKIESKIETLEEEKTALPPI